LAEKTLARLRFLRYILKENKYTFTTMTKTDELIEKSMKWYHYIAGFFAGVFLTNVVPHFVNGITGNAFPTPFANPLGQGLSSPLTNLLWAFFNLLVGYLLFRVSRINSKSKLGLFVFFVGMVFISIVCSLTFMNKAIAH